MSDSEFLKSVCPHCGGHLQFPKENEGASAQCPHCGKPVQLQPKLTVVAETGDAESASKFLARVRGQSCYLVLRATINVIAAFLLLFWLLAGVALALPPEKASPYVPGIDMSFFSESGNVILGMLVAIIGVVLTAAGRQAALLLADIADLLVEVYRRK